ncbi:MAG TPA: hypothetical protein VFQ53_28140 [Kofleriaceae bacterium]|nr:hypothetical protein [Kofleriaceae bacterium]
MQTLARSCLALAMFAGGCASSTSAVPGVRFANQPPVTKVDDRRDVRVAPAPRELVHSLYHFDGSFLRLMTRALELPRHQRARGVNALDEVPDSTWFTNRIGVRTLTPDEIRRGPATVGSPEPYVPWKIKSGKDGGISVGFVIVDARGEKFLLKFDALGFPETETATDAIVGRLLWAFGFNVPEDHVVYFRPGDLVIGPDATFKDELGKKRPMTREELAKKLALVQVEPDGRIRGLASRMLDGKPLGGHAAEGVRGDDPNDRIPHELRRDLRGARAVFSWLDHLDVKEDNSLDMWVADPERPAHHYVKHYWLDFGKSLGFMATWSSDPRRGHEYYVDWPDMLGAFATGGLEDRSWEHRAPTPELRGVGRYEASYDPGTWKPLTPVYVPFREADRFDQFWASKILLRFTRPQLRAAVEAGRLGDPRAAAFLVETLVARQRVTASYWFQRVNPLDRFELVATVGGHALCFDDLALEHRLASSTTTRYAVAAYDARGRALGELAQLRPGSRARSCTGPLPIADGGDGYTMIRIATARPELASALTTIIHVARDPSSRQPRVIGIWRQ